MNGCTRILLFGLIWDDADEMVRLARISHPRIVVDTAGLSPRATELANQLSRRIRELSDAEVEALLALCGERGVAVQTIKSIARRRWPDGATSGRRSWYEPLTDPAAIARAVRFVLSDQRLFLNTTSDATLLPHVLEAAAGDLARPTEAELAADVEAEAITPLFDGAALERI